MKYMKYKAPEKVVKIWLLIWSVMLFSVLFIAHRTIYMYFISIFVEVGCPSFQWHKNSFMGALEKQGSWEDSHVN